ncbi:MAG: serine/threonine-protein kinase [Pseudomonadota bacterium]
MNDASDKWDQLLVTGGGLLGDVEDADEDWSGQTLGAFELLERIGVGGMSSVYRARRTDQFEQQVAVKVMSAALVGDAHRQRFLRERQILADLDHPGIARIIDGGVFGERPYLVMELVAGQAIDHYCDTHQPALALRIKLLAKVSSAVEHAHQLGVVHQDLKPGNVLINEAAEPKLLDFGISGIADAEDEGEHLLTPLYAAPEQFAQTTVTPATDVFQLGILTARVLTGRHPLVARSEARLDEVRRQMASPRLAADLVDGLPSRVRADLMHILTRCLNVEPKQRYASADELGLDLEALAEGEMLPSRATETGYRLKKVAERRRMELSAAAAIIVVALVAGGLVWRQIEEQQAEVKQRGQDAAALGEVVTEILENMDPLEQGGSDPLNDVISSGNFEKLASATRSSPALQRDMVIQSGRALLDAGEFKQVIRLVEPLVNELAVLPEPPSRYAEFLSLLGYARYRDGNLGAGLEELKAALTQLEQEDDVPPEVLALTLQRLALAERRAANIDVARDHMARALSLLPATAAHARQRAQAYSQQGLILTDSGKLQEAVEAFDRSLNALGDLEGDNAVRRAMTLSNLADTLRLSGKLGEGEKHARSAVELLRTGSDNPQLLATASTTLGNVLMARESFTDAGEQYRTALVAYQNDLGELHPRVALVAHNLATALRLSGDCSAALEYYDLSISIGSSHYPTDHPELRESRRQRALCGP